MAIIEYMWKLMRNLDDEAKANVMVAIMDGYGAHYKETGGLVYIMNLFLDELQRMIDKPEESTLDESKPLK